MARIHLLWDASDIWGLLAAWTLSSYGLDWNAVSGRDIAAGVLAREKPALLFVPGGFSRQKFQALGEAGAAKVRDYVRSGGWYLGVCGGAGLGLTGPEGLGLCPWERVGYQDRLQHFMSGHIEASFAAHPLAPEDPPSAPDPVLVPALVPVWWPGLFDPKGTEDTHLTVLARYGEPGPDFRLADLPVASLSADTFADWKERYGFSPSPAFLRGQPCVLHGDYGNCGQGHYTLSYAHLETPASAFANAWLARLLRLVAGLAPCRETVAEWDVAALPVLWGDEGLTAAADGLEALLTTGYAAGLFFDRTPWLLGWRIGMPGAQLGSLRALLRSILAAPPSKATLAFWEKERVAFLPAFRLFLERTRSYLLAEQLALSLSRAVPELDLPAKLQAERRALFGIPGMTPGGSLLAPLLPVLDHLAFLQMHK